MRVRPIAIDEAWSLLSPEATLRIDDLLWARQARTFFDVELRLATIPTMSEDGASASFAIELGTGKEQARVEVVTMPIADAASVRAAADAGVIAIGGAGFDVLVARAKRAWQVRLHEKAPSKEARGSLLVAAVLASVLLAPIVPPSADAIFGVRGARARLEAMGWGT